MKETIIILVTTVMGLGLVAQPVMEIEGSIRIGNNTDPNPELGTMRWSGSDFEVWNGLIWASLTGNMEVGTVTDIDNNVYKTIQIGNQVWMAENLRVTKLNDNTTMDEITNDATWSSATTPVWCYYDNDNSNNNPYGKLYNFYAVNSEKLCPMGWHLPCNTEFTTLTDYLGGVSTAGGRMKATGTLQTSTGYWDDPNTGATNQSGFTGLPGGQRSAPPGPSFEDLGSFGTWWGCQESTGRHFIR